MIESELKITDIDWSDNLTNPDSEMFLEMQDDLEEEMTLLFCDEANSTFELVENDTCSVEVTNFTVGSVIVGFSLTKLELSSEVEEEADELDRMREKISKKGMKKYKVDKESLKISK